MTSIDSRFKVDLIAATPNPQQVIYAAMHQDYSEGYVFDGRSEWPGESEAGKVCVKHLLSGERGHYGPLEHPQITLNVGWFPHSVMQQARTHRVGISFDVQSMRYTGNRISMASEAGKDKFYGDRESLEKVFYLRPVGEYTDRFGKKYFYTKEMRDGDLNHCSLAASRYDRLIEMGCSEEHARGILCFDYRQHFVVSFNTRSLMHFLDLRWKKDAQQEIVWLCDLIWPHFESWTPEIAQWYLSTRAKKARLAP